MGWSSGLPRIVHACDYHLKYATGLACGIAGHGAPVTLLTRTHDGEFGGEPGAALRYVAERAGGVVATRVLPGRVRDRAGLRALRRVRRDLRGFAPEVVHFQDSVGTDLRLLAATGVPWGRFALTVHDASPHPGEGWSLARRATLRALVPGAGVVFVHSNVIAAELRRNFLVRGAVVVIPHGMDPSDVQPLPAVPSLLFFGRIATYYKGLDVLLDAMPLVWERVPAATLTIAGEGTIEDHAALSDPRVEVRNHHIPDSAVPALFAAATCCVLPYREASQSGVGTRAKSHGRAIVATEVGGLPELVAADSGRIVPAGDPVSLADAVVDVLATPGLAEAMGRAAASAVASAGWSRVGGATLEAYKRHLSPQWGAELRS